LSAITNSGGVDWRIRTVLALYPQRWQNEYLDEMLDTLSDVAESKSGLRGIELTNLAARGALMRARTSVAFWGGLIIIGLFFWTSLTYSGFVTERYWVAVLQHAGEALEVALPIAAAIAALRGNGTRRESKPLSPLKRLRIAGLATAPILAFVAVSYVLIVIAELIASGWPLSWYGSVGIPLTYLAMTAGAIAFGYAIGSAMHPVIAVPGAVGIVVWCAGFVGAWPGDNFPWRNITGWNLMENGNLLFEGPVPAGLLATSALAILLVVLASAVVAARPEGPRAVAVVLTLTLSIALYTSGSTWLTAHVGNASAAARSRTELVCTGSAPKICLWPEQRLADGSSPAPSLAADYWRAEALGLPVATTITSFDGTIGSTQIGSPHSTTEVIWQEPAETRAQFAVDYATTLTAEPNCGNVPVQFNARRDEAATYAAAMLFGDSNANLTREFGWSKVGHPLTTRGTQDYYGVHNPAEARAALASWEQHIPTC
jgi:hypothetical protein